MICTVSIAQRKTSLPYDEAEKVIKYDTILIAEGANKEKLQSKVFEWIALNYKSANDVIQMNDKENGTIIAKGVYPNVIWGPVLGAGYDVAHTLTVKFKDGRIKITINNFQYIYGPSSSSKGGKGDLERLLIFKPNGLMPKQMKTFESNIDKRVVFTINGIQEYINKSQNNEDW